MNNKSDKMDRQGARTVADLELKYNMGKSFAEVMGIADLNRMTLEDAKKVITRLAENLNSVVARVTATEEGVKKAEAELILAVKTDITGEVKSVVQFNSDNIVINSENFKLTSNGSIIATNGKFSGVINSAIIGNGSVQLNNNRIEFYVDNAFVGSVTGFSDYHDSIGWFNGIEIDSNNIGLMGNIHLVAEPEHPELNKKIYINGSPAATGWLSVKRTLNDSSYLLFINGILASVKDDKPSDFDISLWGTLNNF